MEYIVKGVYLVSSLQMNLLYVYFFKLYLILFLFLYIMFDENLYIFYRLCKYNGVNLEEFKCLFYFVLVD